MEQVALTGAYGIFTNADFSVSLTIDMDLTGFTGRAMIKDLPDSADEDGTDFVVDFVRRDRPAIVNLSLPVATTSQLRSGKKVWDFWVRSSGGVQTLLVQKGTATVGKGVTPYDLP